VPILRLQDQCEASQACPPEEKRVTRCSSACAGPDAAATGQAFLAVPAGLGTSFEAKLVECVSCLPATHRRDVVHDHDHDHAHRVVDSQQPVDLQEAELYDCVSMKAPGNSAVSSPAQIATSQLDSTAVPMFQIKMATEGRDGECAL
jgi:hypothetical protein